MHGRLKVRTSEEEKYRKDKERQEKLKIFQHAMRKIISKRKQGEKDVEQLELTGKVLANNPDIYTLWNIRREIIEHLRKLQSDEELIKLCDSELSLTEYCLKINPKSYCAWHQREWILKTRADPDWKKELELCNTYLKLDERNFHTWDYRRFVVSHYRPPLQEEFKYTTEKLHDNFSNYSAWHYRSKMLLELYPDLDGGRPIQDSHHKHELKMVVNAVFTDPDDTSAWFYQRWLLGAVKSITHLVVFTLTPVRTTIAFNCHVDKPYLNACIQLYINNELVKGEFVSTGNCEYDDLWIYKHGYPIDDNLHAIRIDHTISNTETETLYCEKYMPCFYVGKNKINFQHNYAEPVLKELKEQLISLRQLQELEPDSKWTVLTTTFFLWCINSSEHHEEILKNLTTLKRIDSQRAGYYSDLITKWSMEKLLPNCYEQKCLDYKLDCNYKITSLPHLQYFSFCVNVDLSNQDLTSNCLPSLIKLQHCKVLNLSNNKLTSIIGLPELNLEELIITGNVLNIEEVEMYQLEHFSIMIFF
ncbi:unnamed protein product [Leptidea sinapis]|uniref:Geranylgeranyl transferase type-2 subunit alpha n=1 Tax=Leptidea sinapis TaxID=189913 RepID=A0A5E4QXV7_9NEOP|nr:unnamed protein product [Leptidea sinapis]